LLKSTNGLTGFTMSSNAGAYQGAFCNSPLRYLE
jgi:hypothetical protein